MKILVTGANGQVGWELARSLAVLGQVVPLTREQADLGRPETLARIVEDAKPDVVVNAAAYTAVDAAETDGAAANVINGEAVGVLAAATKRVGGLFVHYSTDYVFDGTKPSPYIETDPTCPVNAYGASKLLGELAVAETGGDWLTFRTTWVFAARGKNFLRTMLRLAKEREEMKIVADQFGAPTWARSIADGTAHALTTAMRERAAGAFTSGVYHMTSAGQTSWHGFADAIIASWRAAPGAAPLAVSRIVPIPASAYPVPAQRPANSVLSNKALKERFGIELPDWRYAVGLCVNDLLSQ
ncbi:dTDP-4-dehydrorhamnose reductase [Burkholderia pseudomallei]|uniref:dTDP-4-dehydrorhamnose reductase n=9 Tax=pseudomallei group TaxID=111527 RepID=H7C742_BURPS|nr:MULTISPECIES: dTDP-4-dehydrorhamnose reductase [pseudomallei group]EIF68755.1 dTDP-4-dehydrorhamnose reductase [Burkholderia pseudomallei 1258a]KGW50583.1 dTDP-4-dehydrorhamnose reductase [Burkholderia pseudomallei MSHR684]KGX76626.1 dTDP-4-dehydrorhamnose reductase [Burkholderia pseudomallei MSHR435]AAD05457.1 putative dTDP-4-keto-L-rhamnose reductase [Burkholderia pseudomallei 1026b]AAU49981.1 dTDP-4-dehydrorhamnose reductase [Burkholderia mallei ATCC 23344]